SGGECTVSGWGGGIGGPNAEFALAAAIALQGQAGISLIACDTDGVDGAAEVAGALVDAGTLARAKGLGVDARAALQRNDSHSFFAAINGQVVTGPTLTNVNDFRAVLIEPPTIDS
ncbi:MAG: glycerate kinase, partial [Rhodobacteraceae bacterium]|nr:glycerate kinase [Paracoccaceae bacterium]